MVHLLDGIAMDAANGVVAPHRLELWTEPAKLIDKRLHLHRGTRPRGIELERTYDEARDALPIILGSPGVRIEEHHAQ